MIKIDFEFETKYGVFRDALHLSEGHTYTDSEITAMKQERLDNWIAYLEKPLSCELINLDGITYERFIMDDEIILRPVGTLNG